MRAILLIILIAGTDISSAIAQQEYDRPDGLVKALYEEVTFPPGELPDWVHVRTMFRPDALIILRSSRDSLSTFSVDGFIEDFKTFIVRAGVKETGFVERIEKIHTTEYGDIANVTVLYTAQIPGTERGNQGIDSWQLIRKGQRWYIISVINELVRPDRPLPEILRD